MTATVEILSGWSATMGRACWQGGLVVLAVWCICRLLPALPARIQGWLWRLAALKFLIVLLWPVPLPVPLLPVRAAAPAELDPHVSRGAAVQADAPVRDRPGRETLVATGREFLGLRGVLFAAWLAGVGVVLWKLLLAGRAVAAVRCNSWPLDESRASQQLESLAAAFGLRRAPALRAIDGDGSPLLVGVLRAMIVVPAVTWERLTDTERALALEHELAHVKRRDLFWNALAALVRAAFFFHPLMWLCERRLALSQELAADELAVTGGGYDPVRYAQLLLSLVGKLGPVRPLPAMSLGTTGPRDSLRKRILAMQWIGQTTRRVTVASAFLLGAIAILGLIPWTLVAAEADGKKSPEPAAVPAVTPPQDTEVTPPVHIEARFLDAPAGLSHKVLEAIAPHSKIPTLLSPEQTQGFLKRLQAAKGVQVLCTPKVVTRPGQSAKIQIGHVLPGALADADANFEGWSLEVLPESKGPDLSLKIDARRRTRVPGSESPTFRETRIETRLIITPAQTALVAGAEDKGQEFVMLISARILTQGRDCPRQK